MKYPLSVMAAAAFATSAFGTDRLVPQQYPTIQAAVNASVNGDRILIGPGVYSGSIVIANKSLTLKGSTWISSWPQTQVTSSGTVISCSGDGTQQVTLENLFVRDATLGIFADNIDVVMNRCYLWNFNNPGGNGGCYRQQHRSLMANQCAFVGGRAGWGGGIYVGFANATLRDCVIGQCQATLQGSGAFVQSGSTFRAERCSIAAQSIDIVTNCTGFLLESTLCNSQMYAAGAGATVVDLGGNTTLPVCADCDGRGGPDLLSLGLGLPDCDDDLTPDHCDESCVTLQWAVEAGGNGHWYARLPRETRTWLECREAALAVGADLASLGSPQEESFISQLVPSPVWDAYYHNAVFVGATQPVEGPPGANWTWSDGTPWAGVSWQIGQPDGGEGCLGVYRLADGSDAVRFGDWSSLNADGGVFYFMVEWSSDCNRDGVVDYGQLLSGELEDVNHNKVPDCCELGYSCVPCPSDITGNGTVDGVDLAAILAAWGSAGNGKAGTDIDGDGIVSGSDLAIVLGSWGPCP